MKLNRMNLIDTSNHLSILLDYGAFSQAQIGENAKLLLKFVKMTEKVDQEKLRSHQNSFNGLITSN